METILKSGFIRKKQRYYCKACNYNFTVQHEGRKSASVNNKSHQTTLTDIARAMGVSASTVSRALHNHPDISVKKRESIKSLAQKLNYQPNALAQSLASRTTHTIGVIIPDIERPFFASVVSGIQHKATEFGYKIIICQSNESHKTEVANIQTLMSNMIDGLLICHSKETDTFEHIKLHARRGIPIVHFDRVCEDMDTSKILVDDVNGGFCITEHLIQQGYQRIALLGGPEHLAITQKRALGYKNALQQYSIAINQAHIAYCDFSKEKTLLTIKGWLKLKKNQMLFIQSFIKEPSILCCT
jgi:LacI family transcriptional regulator